MKQRKVSGNYFDASQTFRNSLIKALEQIGSLDIQAEGEQLQIAKADLLLAQFHIRDVISPNPGVNREVRLRPTLRGAHRPDALTNEDANILCHALKHGCTLSRTYPL